jgi:hypothetical protein
LEAATILADKPLQLDPALFQEVVPCFPGVLDVPAIKYTGGVSPKTVGTGYYSAPTAAEHQDPEGVVFPTRHKAYVWSSQERLVGSNLEQSWLHAQVSL